MASRVNVSYQMISDTEMVVPGIVTIAEGLCCAVRNYGTDDEPDIKFIVTARNDEAEKHGLKGVKLTREEVHVEKETVTVPPTTGDADADNDIRSRRAYSAAARMRQKCLEVLGLSSPAATKSTGANVDISEL